MTELQTIIGLAAAWMIFGLLIVALPGAPNRLGFDLHLGTDSRAVSVTIISWPLIVIAMVCAGLIRVAVIVVEAIHGGPDDPA